MSGKMARNQTKAFTLIELMVVVVILAIMGVLILPHLGIGKSYTIIAVNGWVEVKDGDKTTTTLNPSAITNIEAVDETHVRISVNRGQIVDVWNLGMSRSQAMEVINEAKQGKPK